MNKSSFKWVFLFTHFKFAFFVIIGGLFYLKCRSHLVAAMIMVLLWLVSKLLSNRIWTLLHSFSLSPQLDFLPLPALHLTFHTLVILSHCAALHFTTILSGVHFPFSSAWLTFTGQAIILSRKSSLKPWAPSVGSVASCLLLNIFNF